MLEVTKILMERDGLTEVEATEQVNEFKLELKEYMDEDAGLTVIEDAFMDTFGLEPDYLIDLLMEL